MCLRCVPCALEVFFFYFVVFFFGVYDLWCDRQLATRQPGCHEVSQRRVEAEGGGHEDDTCSIHTMDRVFRLTVCEQSCVCADAALGSPSASWRENRLCLCFCLRVVSVVCVLCVGVCVCVCVCICGVCGVWYVVYVVYVVCGVCVWCVLCVVYVVFVCLCVDQKIWFLQAGQAPNEHWKLKQVLAFFFLSSSFFHNKFLLSSFLLAPEFHRAGRKTPNKLY